ncbi:hypothetical protein [Glutamicibacter sp. Je.9.36]|uniref:hypothetical protein n=1 Tax=Glutamicibacter sp. Je.9.36 TaxID=3142837 RepID=UPI003DA89351
MAQFVPGFGQLAEALQPVEHRGTDVLLGDAKGHPPGNGGTARAATIAWRVSSFEREQDSPPRAPATTLTGPAPVLASESGVGPEQSSGWRN